MKKHVYWAVMCLVSLLNGAAFYLASLCAMRRGTADVDNQAALLFIPLLWIAAGVVLAALNLYTLVSGRKICRNVYLSELFQFSGLSGREKRNRILFFAAAGMLMVFAYSLFAREPLWALLYAFSGGLLLAFLFAWKQAAKG